MHIRSARWRHEHRRTLRRSVLALSVSVALSAVGATVAIAAGAGAHGTVGSDDGSGILLPTNQHITPYGYRVLDRSGRLLSSSISPNGRYLAALTWNDFTGFLTIVDLKQKKIVQQIGTGAGSDKAIGDGTVAADGPLWSADGRSLWFPQTSDLVHFDMASDGTASDPTVIPMETTVDNLTTGVTTEPDLPSGMALSKSGGVLYVALNGVNRVAAVDTSSFKITKVYKVGNAPRQIVLVGHHAYVSNEGGRVARPGDTTNNSDGTAVVSSKVTGAATTGTVTELDVSTGKQLKQIKVGLQPTAEYLASSHALFVANSNDDSFSIIDPTTNTVAQTVNVNPLPGSTVGSYPNAFTMPNAHTVLVSVGRDNAIVQYHYDGPRVPLKYQGLIPTDWYPVNVQYDSAIKRVVVTNDKGIGARGPEVPLNKAGNDIGPAPATVTGHNTYNDTGSVTTFISPSMSALSHTTHEVFVDNGWEKLLSDKPVKHSTAKPVAVPVHLGDPSTIKHVFLIVKENRTYDQLLGDIGKGDSDPSLAQFGAKVTPNTHKLADTFGLLDNFYDEGTLSADGHNWLVQADANDYIEREFGAFYRSYPAQGGDALAYQRDGFLWNAAENAGKTVRDYGEYNNFLTEEAPAPSWSDYYADSQIMEGKQQGTLPVPVSSTDTYSDIPSLNAIDDHRFPAFDLNIPDQYRVDVWKKDFEKYVGNGKLPNLNLMWLTDDHTAGVGTGAPEPAAEVADNDLAVGRVVSTISHSKYWKSSAVFVLEDDTQNGADSVDGHRGPILVASPYARRGVVNNTYYTQLNVVKTIEQILGIAPMNQEDRAATPMTNVFTNKPDFTPYTTAPNQVPLTAGLSSSSSSSSSSTSAASTTGRTRLAPDYRPASAKSLGVPANERSVYREWVVWSRHQRFSGSRPMADWANPEQLDRLDWYSSHGWTSPYPGDSRIFAPDDVPGHTLPHGYLGDN
ncbi:alkaline phosphatase family protein [Jatrophihabitans endophyticus]|uniref:bifunctional YncE family protein/alkaline phosphatase family protein n=1 Tax=Jatrophihabitans endophyticus TaxID=1206085 RepID=UPI0019E8400E|nr:alkaline phosphatase family protein [Jatrophihabitans endophyticus]MBE7188402.1 hypothetical protein [Jatrophihabitans endophyticus]